MANQPFLGDVSRDALAQFGIDTTLGTDFVTVDRIPHTRTRTTHGLSLRANGRIVGAVCAVDESQTREVYDEWEIDRNGTGAAPADQVPGRLTVRTLHVERYDLYTANLEAAFTDFELVMLTDQTRPFTLRTVWQSPLGIVLGGRAIYEFTGCWFTNLGRRLRTDDASRISRADATISFLLKDRVL